VALTQEQKQEIRDLDDAGISRRAISRQMDVTLATVSGFLIAHHMEPQAKLAIIEDRQSDMKQRDVAQRHSTSAMVVRFVLEEAGEPTKRKTRKPLPIPKAPSRREELLLEFARRLALGQGYSQISRDLEVPYPTVRKWSLAAGLALLPKIAASRPAPKPKRLITDSEAFCGFHQVVELRDGFKVRSSGVLDSWCIEGRREYGRRWSAQAYAPKKAEVAIRRAVVVTKRVCRGCGLEKPVEEFPWRYDRPDKRHARCEVCQSLQQQINNQRSYFTHHQVRLDAKKVWRDANPGYNKASRNRRRNRKRQVRQENYSVLAIRQRDGDLCYFCHQFVDPTIPWPDPLSAVIHHHQPFSKRGPDTAKNVALAHYRCNGAWGNRYDCPFERWAVKPVSWHAARDLVVAHHYLHRVPSVSFAFGLFDGEVVRGVVTFGSPSSWRISKSVAPDSIRSVLELNRLWIADEAPHGAASWFVSRALKQLPPRVVVAYSELTVQDSRYGTYHDGAVYRALSFHYAGQTRSYTDWRMPGKTRNVGKHVEGSVPVEVGSRKRFWTVTGKRSEKRQLFAMCQWPSLPYQTEPAIGEG
jgi:hypothetical protein